MAVFICSFYSFWFQKNRRRPIDARFFCFFNPHSEYLILQFFVGQSPLNYRIVLDRVQHNHR